MVATNFYPSEKRPRLWQRAGNQLFTLLKKSKAVRGPARPGLCGLRLSQPGPESPDPGRPGWAAFSVVFTWESEEKIPFFLSIFLRFMFVL